MYGCSRETRRNGFISAHYHYVNRFFLLKPERRVQKEYTVCVIWFVAELDNSAAVLSAYCVAIVSAISDITHVDMRLFWGTVTSWCPVPNYALFFCFPCQTAQYSTYNSQSLVLYFRGFVPCCYYYHHHNLRVRCYGHPRDAI